VTKLNATRRMACLLFAAVLAVSFGFPAVPGSAAEYRLIVMKGRKVKWGAPEEGVGAKVTYAVVDRQRHFDGARNCPTINPLDGLLETSAIAPATFAHELEAAFAAWSSVANIRFEMASPAEADILIGAETRKRGRAFTNVEYIESAGSTERASLTRSVICLNTEQPWKVGFDGNLEVYDLRYTLTHEIGHAIGLDHPGKLGELMDFRYHEAFRVPQSGDIAGVVAIYGSSTVKTAARDMAQPGITRVRLSK